MCITEDKLVESYGKASPRERFRLIYKNYCGAEVFSGCRKYRKY